MGRNPCTASFSKQSALIGVLLRDSRGETQTQRRSPVKTEAEMGGVRPQAQGRLEAQKLEEAGRTLPWSLWRERSPGTP